MSETMDPQTRADLLMQTADELRPPIQALLDYVVQGAKSAASAGGNPDEVWAALVVSSGQGLSLDLTDPMQMRAACAVAELVLRLAGADA
jgi:hypothetical protein